MAWGIIANISTWISLIAFLAATAAWVFKVHSARDERLIRTATTEQQATLVRKVLATTDINTDKLTKDQQYKLALEQTQNRVKTFKITAIVVCFLATIALSVTTFAIYMNTTIDPPPDNEARFDVKFESIKYFKVGKQIRAQLTLHAFPLTNKNTEAATIFTGKIDVHNEDLYDKTIDTSNLTCKEIKSCLYAKVFEEYTNDPIIVKGGNPNPVNITSIFDIPPSVKLIRIWFAFYQKEANNNNLCTIDTVKPPLKEEIPYLKVITTKGEDTTDKCWQATDVIIQPVAL
ncbi:hypothetical protein PMI35_01479 [Pseudomonas sp. GM78]|uniref:hypothetical protein n=1 Tax=Pseudomonas sp. GM78 TaxID=1144337 RepID=UPI00026FC284|nr:hypothetical protein [Pseudomonas sp. GM78]EJN31344.1 hypothetical protein PMI35_01479 [Pseudomonas sp. GM78]